MLPNFMCVGAQKSGTTSIWHLLDAHPDVCMARPRETRFFCDSERFAEGTGKYEIRCFGHWNGEAAIGEKCPEYLCEPFVPQRIRATLGPAVRFIIALRSPAQRAYCHYRHNRAMLRECRSFDAAVSAELRAEEQGALVPTPYAYLARSRYAAQLERYLTIFGAEQLLLVNFETEVAVNQRALAARLYEFLGVAPFEPGGTPYRSGHPPLEDLSIRIDASHFNAKRHFVEIQRPSTPRRWLPGWLIGKHNHGRSVERIYHPSPSLREFAEQFVDTGSGGPCLARDREADLNMRYFREDIEQLRALVPFDVDYWLTERDTGAPRC